MKTLAIVLVGGAANIPADGLFGVLALLRLIQGQRAAPKIVVCLPEYPPSKLLGKTKRAGYCSPSVTQIGALNKGV